jgi:hypothetical protein
MRKTALILLAALALTGCNANPPDSSINENDVIGGQVTVNFLSSAEQWSTEEVVTTNKDYYLQHEPDYLKADTTQTEDDYLQSLMVNDMLSFWKVGTIQNGDYAGQSLVLAREACDGPCQPLYFRYAVDEDTGHWTTLLPYSDEVLEGTPGGPANDQEASIEIPSLTAPQALDLYATDPVMIADKFAVQNPGYFGFTDENFNTNYKVLTGAKDSSFAKYYTTDNAGCLYGETPDGILVRYQIMPVSFNFMPGAKGGQVPEPVQVQDVILTLPDGSTENHSYTLFAGGCGFASSCLSTIRATGDEESSLIEVGSIIAKNGPSETSEKVYTIPLEGLADYATGLRFMLSDAYDGYKMNLQYKDPPETALSVEEFLAQHEVVLLKLDTGAYTLAYDSAVAPSGECGKPVIYLYPTAAQQVSVKVNNIAFTKTVPAYGNGWTVWAEPSGVLKNLADGKTYPYLFWEGNSSAKLSIDQGWTLAKKDIASKLPVALTSMGLSTKESADFMEFWLPKLQAVTTPYVRFNFEGTAAMNIVAPLTITPAPDSLLRVFMVYQGVNQAGLSMPAYTAPARSGFSVVEWGGTLY